MLTVKGKILMTVLIVVLMFALFILFYFPARQERYLIENYDEEIENFAKTVALGVKIALTEQNFEGVETAIDFVRHDKRLRFVSLIQTDTLVNPADGKIQIKKTVFKTFPENVEVDPTMVSTENYIVKSAPFSTPTMAGEILLSFSTDEIIKSRWQIRLTSILVSIIVFVIGMIMGFLLARNISRPVLALRDAANKVGEGDLTQSVKNTSRDEIGELSIAFNKMVKDLSIDAALDRIRSTAMAMQQSIDLPKTVEAVLVEMDHIGLFSEYRGIGIVDSHEIRAKFWTTKTSHEDKIEMVEGELALNGHALLERIFKAWENQEPYAYPLEGEDLKVFYRVLQTNEFRLPEDVVRESLSHILQFCYIAPFQAGILIIFRDMPLAPGNVKILERFADVFNLAYTRFQDLLNSEKRTWEETKNASLDRVRGEIASMRTKEDLQRITPLIWQELKILDVPFFRCGVFIVDETKKMIQAYLSLPDGQSLGDLNIPFNVNNVINQLVDNWRNESIYLEHWDRERFLQWMEDMIEIGQIQNMETYQGASHPPESLYLHFIPFKQGMMYVGNNFTLDEDKLELVQVVAEAFSVAYTRYEDFRQLEEAKNKMEITLGELKATQSQLIHAEKMASLGELTAGIAHEIQNPLNFVNNFSEVSADLIQEMKEELTKGNKDELNTIAEVLKNNLEKITHHGKRASSIVKGMLEHSRTGKREKELTDLNLLADEYLRLAYHGLRAKDKTFQAQFETDFEKSLPMISVISQDIGRVLLNLINNAFYAVSIKAKRGINGYVPKVKVSTKKLKDQIEIRVKDNADGIPDDVLAKVFQPFFTTKPTGQGTGLGLSLSYDIITTGHGGKLKIETTSGEGTDFIILLPHKPLQ